MKRIIVLSILTLIFFTSQLSAQVAGNLIYNQSNRWQQQNQAYVNPHQAVNPNMVSFKINALYNVQAESYLAIFHLTQLGNSAREADSLMSEKLDAFQADVMDLGISEENFVYDMLSMVPVYEVEVSKRLFSKSYTEVPRGFEIQKNIHIKFTDPRQLDKIVTAAAIHEIYDLVKVDYMVKDIEKIYDTLRERATAQIQEKVEQYKKLGVNLEDEWRGIAESQNVIFPLERYQSYRAFGNVAFERELSNEKLKEARKPTTQFYNKISYKGYDIVIEPETVEPVVQFTYSIELQYYREKPVKEKKEPEPKVEYRKEYILVNPDGVIKPLPLN
ncbi:SIMPL domain-containing protein [Halocola ammonii]